MSAYACMHVYAHICMYIFPAQVNACICMYMPYMHVYCKYMHVYTAMNPYKTGICCHLPKSQSLWTPSSGPNSGHPWAYGKSVLFVIGNIFADPISGTTPLSTPPGPLLHPPGSSGKPPAP